MIKLNKDKVLFDATLHPNMSLPTGGFLLLMAFLATICFCAGVAFVLAGAWPVFGFLGIDVLIVYLAFKLNYRNARRFETLQLTNEILTVERVAPSGKRKSWHLQPYWLQVELDKNASPGGRLILRSHGRILEIGSFLTEGEKINLAQTLREKIAALRS